MILGFDLDGVLCDISVTELALLHGNNNKHDMIYYKSIEKILFGEVKKCPFTQRHLHRMKTKP